MTSEQRKHPRIPAAFSVELVAPDGTTTAKTRDISDGGAFVIFREEDLTPDMHMRLTVRVMGLPTGPGDPIECEVVRKEGEGVGLRFVKNEGES